MLSRCVWIATLVVVLLISASAQAAEPPREGLELDDPDKEIWVDRGVDPEVYYNKDAIVMDKNDDGSYTVAKNQPMTFSDAEGETEGLEMATRPDGVTQFKLQEDNDQAKISEHSVTYNDSAMNEALAAQSGVAFDENENPPQADVDREVTWVVTDEDGNEVERQTGENTSYAPSFNTPGLYQLSNGGVSEVNDTVVASGTYDGTTDDEDEAEKVVAGGEFTSGQQAELEVVDVTAPAEGVVEITPEDTFEVNKIELAAGPELDKYPMTDKKAILKVDGKNFAKEGVTDKDTAQKIEKECKVDYGEPYVPEKYKDKGTTVADVGNGKKEVYLRSKNKIDFAKASGVEGVFLPVHVRTRFKVGPFKDNRKKDPVKTTWELSINRDGTDEKLEEPPHYTFPVPNYDKNGPIADAPKYTFTYAIEDLSGNSTAVEVPIYVLPVGVKIQDIDLNQGRGD